MPKLSANSCDMCQSPVSIHGLRISAYLCYSVLHHLLVRHIALVAYEELVDTLCGIAVNLLQPLLHVVERVHVGHIVDDADAVSATVVGGGDGAETFLSSCVPLWSLSAYPQPLR